MSGDQMSLRIKQKTQVLWFNCKYDLVSVQLGAIKCTKKYSIKINVNLSQYLIMSFKIFVII